MNLRRSIVAIDNSMMLLATVTVYLMGLAHVVQQIKINPVIAHHHRVASTEMIDLRKHRYQNPIPEKQTIGALRHRPYYSTYHDTQRKQETRRQT